MSLSSLISIRSVMSSQSCVVTEAKKGVSEIIPPVPPAKAVVSKVMCPVRHLDSMVTSSHRTGILSLCHTHACKAVNHTPLAAVSMDAVAFDWKVKVFNMSVHIIRYPNHTG